MTVMRCPHCGGEVSFDPEGQDIRCEYCDSILSIDDYRNYLDSKGMYQANELVCSQCGASIISTDATVATFCSFCGSPLVLDSRIREEKKPDLIIPFRVKKAAAVKKYREKIQNTLLAPDWMSDDDSIEKFRGIYMPFHLFRYSGNGVYRGKATSNKVEKINGEKHYFTSLNRGELAANSDHYPFATRHIPCIFLENENGDAFPYYHTIYDNWKHAVFDSYEPVFKLVTDFIDRY